MFCAIEIRGLVVRIGLDRSVQQSKGLVGTARGIFNQGGSVTLSGSTVNGNSANVGSVRNGAGGILSSGGGLTLTNSTVSGNTATSEVSFSTAVGGIAIGGFTGPANLTLTNSTVAGNSATAPCAASALTRVHESEAATCITCAAPS